MTNHLSPGVPSLPKPEVKKRVRALVAAAHKRGCVVLAYCLGDNHIHRVVRARSRKAMAAAMRFLCGELAKFMNRLGGGRRGPVWNDRYAVVVGKSAKQVWHMMNDVALQRVEGGPATRHSAPVMGPIHRG